MSDSTVFALMRVVALQFCSKGIRKLSMSKKYEISLTSEFESSDSANVGELRGEEVADLRQPRDSRPGQPLAEAVPGNGGALPPPHLGKEGIDRLELCGEGANVEKDMIHHLSLLIAVFTQIQLQVGIQSADNVFLVSVQGISNTRVISDFHSKSPDLVIIIIDLSEVTVPDE